MYVTKTKNAAKAALAAAVLLTATGSVQAKNAAYAFTAIETEKHGVEVINGEYEAAIARIRNHTGDETNFSESTNLCIAYTKIGELADAIRYCDRAVGIARMTDGMRQSRGAAHATFGNYHKDLDLVIALSNRGVAHAASGDYALAAHDLREADALSARLIALPTNLDVLAEAMKAAR
jgi:tetratricopeptide (TPR) repeat protein